MRGGERVARVLLQQGAEELFTLCGGHVSPILVDAERLGIRVVDVRHEAHAVFAADARARLGGVGVAVVTAGPGLSNTVTALRNAFMARSPLVLIGGATATALVGRGALQDIDQRALVAPHVKRVLRPRRLRELAPALERAFRLARADVPGPVFVETPVDLLYPEEVVRRWYLGVSERAPRTLAERALRLYLRRHVDRLFAGGGLPLEEPPRERSPRSGEPRVGRLAQALARAERPLIVVGSPALRRSENASRVADALRRLAAPVFLSGMARGLLGVPAPPFFRHKRREALKESDLVILAGVPCDFRLDYGRALRGRTKLASLDIDSRARRLNRRPSIEVAADAGDALIALAGAGPFPTERWQSWHAALAARDNERDREIAEGAACSGAPVDPVHLLRTLDGLLDESSVLVADGGDFVGTAAYTLAPRAPLSWLDPGPFGTLGCGAGFALAAKLAHPGADVWLLLGDGSSAYSLAEFDTFVRHRLGVVALVGNDACWSQIARDQVKILGSPVGTELVRSDYERVAEGFGARGLRIESAEEVRPRLEEARAHARAGVPVLVNAHIARGDFREGSLSI